MIKPGVASKDLVESMQYFFLSGKDIVAYNDRISILYPFKTSFSAFIKADSFYNIMVKSSSDSFQLLKKGEKVTVKAKGLKINLPTVVDDEVIGRIKSVQDSLKDVKWYVLPETFLECINLCSFAASTSESENTLSCVYIEKDKCCATDNNRIALATLNKKMKPMFIKASEVKNLSSVNPIHYTASKAWLHFKNKEGCIFSLKRVKGSFPDILPQFEFEGKKLTLPQNLSEGTDLASIFASEKDQPSIKITIEKNGCVLSVDSEGGNLEFFTKIEYSGGKLEFNINPDFLLEMMKYSASILLATDRAKLETENFALVTALMSQV